MNLVSLIFLTFFTTSNVSEVVKEYHELKTKTSEFVFIKKYKQSLDPSVLAYLYAIEMKQAKYCGNPLKKLKIFNTIKKKLITLIEENPNNIHLRYIRLVLQEKTPSLLGFNKKIEEDKSFLKEKLKIVDESDYLDFYIQKNTSL
jgi:hypothetical protein